MAQKLEVVIVGDTKDLERALGRAGKTSKTFGQRVQSGAKVAGLALGGILAVGAKAGFDELMEGQKVAAQTNAVLKSTGGVARVTAKDVDTLARSLSEKSGIDDEVIASGENLLLTFKNIRNGTNDGANAFDRATAAALDLSVALGKDMNSSVLMLGKALNDPIKGMTALGRAGVQFTAAQKKQIEMLVKSNRLYEAQKMILAEVESQVGGSAAAYGETLPGQLGKAQIAYEEMTASIMLALLPAITAVTSAANRFATFMQEHPKAAKAMSAALVVLAAAFLATAAASAAATIAAAPWIAAVVAVAVAIGVLIVALRSGNKWIRALGVVALGTISPFAALALAVKRSFGTIKAAASGAFNAVRSAVNAVIGVLERVWGWLSALTSRVWSIKVSLPDPTPGFDVPGIPGFAQGGVVPGPIGRPRLAVVHGGETVLPTHKRGGAATHVHFHGNVYGSPAEIARMVKRELAFQENRSGG